MDGFFFSLTFKFNALSDSRKSRIDSGSGDIATLE